MKNKIRSIMMSIALLASMVVGVSADPASPNPLNASVVFAPGVAVTDRENAAGTQLVKNEVVTIVAEMEIKGIDETVYNIKSVDLELGVDSSFTPQRGTRTLRVVRDTDSKTKAMYFVTGRNLSYYGKGASFVVEGTVTYENKTNAADKGTIEVSETFVVDEAATIQEYEGLSKDLFIEHYVTDLESINVGDSFILVANIVDPNIKYDDLTAKQLESFYAILNSQSFVSNDRNGKLLGISKSATGHLCMMVEFDNVRYRGQDSDFTFTLGYDAKLMINKEAYKYSQQKSVTIDVFEVSFGGGSSSAYAPKVLISSYTGSEGIYAGKTKDITITLKNNSKTTAVENMVVAINGGQAFVLAKGVNKVFVDKIEPGKTHTITFSINASKTAPTGPQVISFTGSYDYAGGSGSIDGEITIPVKQVDKVVINSIKSQNAYTDQEAEVNYSILNSGMAQAYNANLELFGQDGVSLGSIFLGKIAAGAEAKGSNLYVYFTQAGEQTIKAVLTYENEDLEQKTIEKEIEVVVNETWKPGYGGYDEPTWEDPIPEAKNQNNLWLYITVGVVVIGGGAFYFIKKKKAKKGVVEDEDL